MLGVATVIVVNAVMLGFTNEMQVRIHGILADVIFRSLDLKGFPDAPWHIEQIRKAAGDLIEEVTPTIVVPGMLTYRVNGTGAAVSKPIELVGIDAVTQSKVSKITSYLQHPENRKELSFDLREEGYDILGSGSEDKAARRFEMGYAGWKYRRHSFAEREKARQRNEEEQLRLQKQFDPSKFSLQPAPNEAGPSNPFASMPPQQAVFDPSKEQHAGAIIGFGLSLIERRNDTDPDSGQKMVIDRLSLIPGDDVMLTFPTAEIQLKLQSDSFTIVDLYESKMLEYDQRLVFVPIEKLQQLRGMIDPATGKPMVTQILIKAKPGKSINEIRDRLRSVFPPELFMITTWRDEQQDLLSAVFNELVMLNVLLFLIFAVAGFGIFAIFYMIVIEKQKDIGIMKSLGASSSGVLQIFLSYSLLLGIVGSGLGLVMGLLFVKYIKEIAKVLSYILQSEVFSPEVYSFYEIPTVVEPITVCWIVAGAIFIAVISGVFPAMRAARLNPVETLRS
jgi:lipoprotein-releasing system permease protein